MSLGTGWEDPSSVNENPYKWLRMWYTSYRCPVLHLHEMGTIYCLENMSQGIHSKPTVIDSLRWLLRLLESFISCQVLAVWAANPWKPVQTKNMGCFLGFLFPVGLKPNAMMLSGEYLSFCSLSVSTTPVPPMLGHLFGNCLKHKIESQDQRKKDIIRLKHSGR